MVKISKIFDIGNNSLYDNESKQRKLKEELEKLAKKEGLLLVFEVEDDELFVEVAFEAKKGGYAVSKEKLRFIDNVADRVEATRFIDDDYIEEAMPEKEFVKMKESFEQALEHKEGKRKDLRVTKVQKKVQTVKPSKADDKTLKKLTKRTIKSPAVKSSKVTVKQIKKAVKEVAAKRKPVAKKKATKRAR